MTTHKSVTASDEPLGLDEGWDIVDSVGVFPFIKRIESGIDAEERYTIKADVFMKVYE